MNAILWIGLIAMLLVIVYIRFRDRKNSEPQNYFIFVLYSIVLLLEKIEESVTQFIKFVVRMWKDHIRPILTFQGAIPFLLVVLLSILFIVPAIAFNLVINNQDFWRLLGTSSMMLGEYVLVSLMIHLMIIFDTKNKDKYLAKISFIKRNLETSSSVLKNKSQYFSLSFRELFSAAFLYYLLTIFLYFVFYKLSEGGYVVAVLAILILYLIVKLLLLRNLIRSVISEENLISAFWMMGIAIILSQIGLFFIGSAQGSWSNLTPDLGKIFQYFVDNSYAIIILILVLFGVLSNFTIKRKPIVDFHSKQSKTAEVISIIILVLNFSLMFILALSTIKDKPVSEFLFIFLSTELFILYIWIFGFFNSIYSCGRLEEKIGNKANDIICIEGEFEGTAFFKDSSIKLGISEFSQTMEFIKLKNQELTYYVHLPHINTLLFGDLRSAKIGSKLMICGTVIKDTYINEKINLEYIVPVSAKVIKNHFVDNKKKEQPIWTK